MHRPTQILRVAILLALPGLIACTDGGEATDPEPVVSVATCVPGESQLCLCDVTDRIGTQLCAEDGTFLPCECPPPSDEVPDPNACTPQECNCGDGAIGYRRCEGDALGPCLCPRGSTFNQCGGRAILPALPGNPCGPCNDGVLVCDGIDNTRCVGATAVNACGGCARLAAAVGANCGPCGDGATACDGPNALVCVGNRELNACGGCSTLTDPPGFTCNGLTGTLGTLVCDTLESTACVGPGQNACGGSQPLDETPGTPCGICGDGRRVCASPDAIVCLDADSGQNACGGCGELPARPGDPCGACGGEWQCDGSEALVCSIPLNPCGGCSELDFEPGGSCGSAEIYACDGGNAVECRPSADTNACGGTMTLADAPGAPCGECSDGKYVCAGIDGTVCVEDVREINRCGGCGPLANVPGESCGANGRVWQCSDNDATVCVIASTGATNSCGGVATLEGTPGESCESCGRWVCDPNNPDLVFCLGGSPGLETDDDNCGMCGMRCLNNQVCSGGTCVTDRVVQIESADGPFTVARLASGTVEGWGVNQSTGPVGNGDLSNFIYEPARASLIADAVDIATGQGVLGVAEARRGATVCAIRGDGSVWCWGDNREQQLGYDSSISARSVVPVEVPGIENATDIAIGRGTVCAIRMDKTLWCWGNNDQGKRGSGTFDAPIEPTPVVGLTDVEEVVVTDVATCARDSFLDVYCWGGDSNGQLGDGSPESPATPTPQRVTTLGNIKELAGFRNGFVARSDIEVFHWGRIIGNDGRFTSAFSPLTLAQSGTPVRLWTTADNLFVENPGGVIYMWGLDNGRSGTNTGGYVTRQRIGTIPGTANVQSIDGPPGATIVLMDDGGLFTTGVSDYQGDGQLHSLSSSWTTRQFHAVPFYPPFASETGNCFDSEDNDRDGLLNCADPDCAVDVGNAEGAGAITDLVSFDWYNYREATCAGTSTRERFYRWTAPRSGTFVISSGLTVRDTRIEVLEACATAAVSLGCDDGDFSGSTTEVVFSATGGESYVFLVDVSAFGDPAVSLDITELP